jgi:hypothetical protein
MAKRRECEWASLLIETRWLYADMETALSEGGGGGGCCWAPQSIEANSPRSQIPYSAFSNRFLPILTVIFIFTIYFTSSLHNSIKTASRRIVRSVACPFHSAQIRFAPSRGVSYMHGIYLLNVQLVMLWRISQLLCMGSGKMTFLKAGYCRASYIDLKHKLCFLFRSSETYPTDFYLTFYLFRLSIPLTVFALFRPY